MSHRPNVGSKMSVDANYLPCSEAFPRMSKSPTQNEALLFRKAKFQIESGNSEKIDDCRREQDPVNIMGLLKKAAPAAIIRFPPVHFVYSDCKRWLQVERDKSDLLALRRSLHDTRVTNEISNSVRRRRGVPKKD